MIICRYCCLYTTEWNLPCINKVSYLSLYPLATPYNFFLFPIDFNMNKHYTWGKSLQLPHTQYGVSSRKRSPGFDILDCCLGEFRLYCTDVPLTRVPLAPPHVLFPVPGIICGYLMRFRHFT